MLTLCLDQPRSQSLLQTLQPGAELSEKQRHQTHELPLTSALATPQQQAVPITNPHSTAAPPRAARTPAEVRTHGTAQNSPGGHHQGGLSKKYRCSSYFYSWFETGGSEVPRLLHHVQQERWACCTCLWHCRLTNQALTQVFVMHTLQRAQHFVHHVHNCNLLLHIFF